MLKTAEPTGGGAGGPGPPRNDIKI